MLMLFSVIRKYHNAHHAGNEASDVLDTEPDTNSFQNELVARKAEQTIQALLQQIPNRYLQLIRQQH
jgi:hypothetical protein